MGDLEVKVLGYKGRPREGISVSLDFTGDWYGLMFDKWGIVKGHTDHDGSFYFSYDPEDDGASFDLYVDHNKEGDYNLGRDDYIEVNLTDDEDDEDDQED